MRLILDNVRSECSYVFKNKKNYQYNRIYNIISNFITDLYYNWINT